MEVPKEIDKILGDLRKEALTTTREFSPHLIFFPGLFQVQTNV